MALDPSIALGIKPVQIESPINQMAKMYEMQNIVQANKLNQMKMDEYTRGVAKSERFNNALAQAKNEEDVKNAFISVGDIKGYQDYLKGTAEQAKLGAETTNLGYTGKKTQGEIVKQRQEFDNQAKRDLSFNPSDENIKAFAQDAVLKGIYTQDEAARATAQLLSIPMNQRQTFLAGQGATAGDLSTAATAKAGQAITMRGQDITAATAKAGQDITVRGQNLTNKRELERIAIEKGRNSPEYIKAEAKAREQGKAQAKFEANAPQALVTAKNAVTKINDLLTHPGLNAAVGAGGFGTLGIPGVAKYVPGTDAADFKARLDEVLGGAFMEAFNTLKGGGQITEKEGEKATAAITRMSTSQSEAEFKKAAKEFQSVIKSGIDQSEKRLGVTGDVDANNPLLKQDFNMAATLAEVLKDPNYVNANAATKAAIFDKFSAKDPNYANANDATKSAIRTKFGVSVTAPAPVAEAPAADSIPQRSLTQQIGYPILEAGLSTVGGVLGGVPGTIFGPAGTVAGAATGAGLGYAGAKEIEKLIENNLGQRVAQPLANEALDAAKNTLIGATFEVGGRALLPPVAKAAGWVWDAASGRLAQIKAGKIVQELAGPELEALKAASAKAPKGVTGGQAIAGVDAPPLQTLATRAAEKAPYVFRPIQQAQEAQILNELQRLAKGASQTGSKVAQTEAKNALNAQLIPTLSTELNAANIAGKELPRLQGEANRLAQAAASKVEDVRRMTGAGERAKELSKTWISSAGGAEGLVRRPIQYTYPGQLAKAADEVAAKAADASLNFGEAARFAQAGADSLAAHGLKPLKSDAIIASIAGKAKDPTYAGNDIIEGALKNVTDDIAKWTANGGVIDAWALDSIRKNSVNAAVQRLRPSMDQTAQKNAAAEVITKIKPILVDAIENAGGTGYGKYLSDYTAGRQAISQTKLGAKALQLYKDSPDKFISLVEGNSPEVVEKVFGKGNYNIAKELSNEAMQTLKSTAGKVSQAKSMAEQSKAGATMYEDIIKAETKKFPRLNLLRRDVTLANETIDMLETKLNKKVMENLVKGMKSGQSLSEMLNAVPVAQRNIVLQAFQKDPIIQRGVSTSVNALAQ